MRTDRAGIFSGSKIRSRAAIKKLVPRLKAQGKTIVFTNGCFDLLHYGHVKYLARAKAKGDILIVGVNSDVSVRKLKGEKRPIVGQNDRAGVLAGLSSVDLAVIFGEETPLELIKTVKPDILVKGADWQKPAVVGADFVSSYGGKTLTIPLAKNRSTSLMIKKIAHAYQSKKARRKSPRARIKGQGFCGRD